MGFFGKFFVAIFVVCAAHGAWATGCTGNKQNCADGKYNRYGCVVGGLMPVTGYECVSCPAPFDKSGTTQQTIEDCYVEQHCGTGETCALYYGNQSGTCQNSTGNTGNYHLELVNNSAVCYANTRACSKFSNRTENDDIVCARSAQQNQAFWNETGWNVGGCSCNIVDMAFDACDKFNARFYISQENQIVPSATDRITYTMSHKYCSKCHPGYLPKIETSAQINGVYVRPENSGSGNWGVVTCSTQVTAPDYAPGCIINFNETEAAVMASCRQECPTGFETDEAGAESISDCVAQYTPDFEDQTGRFVLTSLDSCQ